MGRGPHSRPSDRDKRAVAEPREAVTTWETDRVWDGLHRVHWGPGPSRPATWRVSCFGGAAPNKPAEPEHVSLPRATPPEVLRQEAASDRRRADTDVGALRLPDVCERPAALALDVPRSRAASKRRSCGRRRLLLSPSPPGAARGAGPADASRGKAGGGRGRVSDPAGLGAAVCTSRGGGTPRGHRRGDRRRCRVLGAVIKLSCVLLRRTPGRKRSGAGEGRAQAPPLSTRSLTLRVLALGGSSLRQICTSCFSQFFPQKSFKCKNLRKRSFRCCPAPRRHTRRLRRESAEAARPWRARGRARRSAVSVGGDGDVCSSDSVDLVRKPSRELFTL